MFLFRRSVIFGDGLEIKKCWVFRNDEATSDDFNEAGYYGQWICIFELQFQSAAVFPMDTKFSVAAMCIFRWTIKF